MQKMKPLTNSELISFCEHMSMTLKAGLTPAAGIDLMLEDTTDDEGRAILLPIAEKCNDGFSFSDAIKASGVFPDYAVHMIEIGNASGKLDEVMESLANHYTREESIRDNIKSAVTYPFLIILMMLVVILVLVIKVLPIFQQVFVQLGTELTGFSKSLLHLGGTLTTYSAIFIGVFILLAILFVYFTKTRSGRDAFSSFCSHFFLTKPLFEKIASARFASGMAITISAGLDPENSLDMVEKLVDKTPMMKKVKRCRALMEGDEKTPGIPFSKALVESSIFSHMYAKMIGIGFTTGSVDSVFQKIANSYDKEIEKSMNDTVSILEPTLVIVLSIIVCLILLSVVMPLMGIMSTIG